MSTFEHLIIIFLLISTSSFFSMSEIAVAASRKARLQARANEGDGNAQKVLALQDNPGHFFTVVQIGLNAVAILGGILGESVFTPHIVNGLSYFFDGAWIHPLSFSVSIFLVTSLYILFADLIPKRIAMLAPETTAMLIVQPMLFLINVLKPFVWLFNGLCTVLLRLFRVSTLRDDAVTPEDIMAMMDAGARAGVLQQQEHELLGNVFEMESRSVASAMTPRESLIYFTMKDTPQDIKSKISHFPHVKFLVADEVLDRVIGYVDSRKILTQVLNDEPIDLKKEGMIQSVLMIPDTLTLYEVLEQFKSAGNDFAVILNEYAFVMGIITLKDVMSIVMGELVSYAEEQIVQRDADSWLLEGSTPLSDVMRVLDIDRFPDPECYETIAGFMMYALRKIPKRTDFVVLGQYKFEVVDIDNYKIDQLLVTRLPSS